LVFVATSAFLLAFHKIGNALIHIFGLRDVPTSTQLCFGLSAYYAAALSGLSLGTLHYLIVGAAVYGLFDVAKALQKKKSRIMLPKFNRLDWFALVILLGAVFANTAYAPLWGGIGWGDARSIWFFHAKIIYYDGRLMPAEWNNPYIFFSHPDYPKLIPLVGAQMARFFGYWNEYVPKLSLVVLLMITVSCFASYLSRRNLPLWIACISLLICGSWLWVGYMDGYLALLSALGLTQIATALAEEDAQEFWRGILLLILCTYLKGEGILLLFSAVVVLFVVKSKVKKRLFTPHPFELALVPTVLWMARARSWGLHNDTIRGFSELSSALKSRIVSLPSLGLIFTKVWLNPGLCLAAAAFTSLLVIRRKKLIPSDNYLIGVSVLYTGILSGVYVVTPYNLSWHLTTSADRVVAPVVYLLALAALILFATIIRRRRA
jgi:hypothetical protein